MEHAPLGPARSPDLARGMDARRADVASLECGSLLPLLSPSKAEASFPHSKVRTARRLAIAAVASARSFTRRVPDSAGPFSRAASRARRRSRPRIDQLAQIVHQRFEDQRHVEPPLNVVVGLDAAVGQDEDVFGLEAFGQRDGGPAVGVVGAGGRQAGGLPEDAAEETGQLADQQAGPAPLVDRFLARLLDVGACSR